MIEILHSIIKEGNFDHLYPLRSYKKYKRKKIPNQFHGVLVQWLSRDTDNFQIMFKSHRYMASQWNWSSLKML